MSRKTVRVGLSVLAFGLFAGSHGTVFAAPSGPGATPEADDSASHEYAIELREVLGLRSDDAFVRAAQHDPLSVGAVTDDSGDHYGLALLPSEAEDLAARQRVERFAAVEVSEVLRKELGVDFLSISLDSNDGAAQTRAIVSISGESDRARELVDSVLPAELRRSFVIRISERSVADLIAVRTELTRAAGGDDDWGRDVPGMTGLAFDLEAGVVVVEVNGSAEGDRLADTLRRQFAGRPVRIESVERFPTGVPVCGAGNHKCDEQWLYGGLRLASSWGGGCSTGMSVRYGGNTYPAFLTAGHCLPAANTGTWSTGRFSQGGTSYSAARQVGWSVARVVDGQGAMNTSHPNGHLLMDVGLVYNSANATRPSIGRVHRTTSNPADFVAGIASPVINSVLCNTGYRSTGDDGWWFWADGVRCGAVTGIDSRNDGFGQPWPYRVNAEYTGSSGDSGALVFLTANTGERFVVSTHDGIYAPPGWCWNGTWIPHTVGLQGTWPCRPSYSSPTVTTFAVWGLTFQGG